ncbi:hypothetical protein ABK040_009490 [Willaertia magna]
MSVSNNEVMSDGGSISDDDETLLSIPNSYTTDSGFLSAPNSGDSLGALSPTVIENLESISNYNVQQMLRSYSTKFGISEHYEHRRKQNNNNTNNNNEDNSGTQFTKERALEYLTLHLPALYRRTKYLQYIKKGPELKKARKRQDLIKETLETERTYVNSLFLFLQLYYWPLMEERDQGKGILSNKTYKQVLFSNVEQIYRINSVLLDDLEQLTLEKPNDEDLTTISSASSLISTSQVMNNNAIQAPRRATFDGQRKYCGIAKPFVKLVPFLRAYSTFINNFDKSRDCFEELRKKKKKFKEFLVTCYNMQKGIKYDFQSFHILPIQRIPRYRSLLTEILAITPPDHVEYVELQKIVAEVEKIASEINEQKRDYDNVRYLYEVHGVIEKTYPGFIQSHRKFIRKSSFYVKYRIKQPTTNNNTNIKGLSPNTGVSTNGHKPFNIAGGMGLLAAVGVAQQQQEYLSSRFNIYIFSDMLVMFDERQPVEETPTKLMRKPTILFKGDKAESENNQKTNDSKSKYGSKLPYHLLFLYFVDYDTFFNTTVHRKIFGSDIDPESDIPLRLVVNGELREYIIQATTTQERAEFYESLSSCIKECANNLIVKEKLVKEKLAKENFFQIGKQRTELQDNAMKKLSSHQQAEKEQMMLRVRTNQVSKAIQEKKELLLKLQKEIKELEEEKVEKEKKFEELKDKKVSLRENLAVINQGLQSCDSIAITVLHDDKEAFKLAFGQEYGAPITISQQANDSSTTEAAIELLMTKTKTDQESEKRRETIIEGIVKPKSPNGNATNTAGNTARKVTIKHTQFIQQQLKK